VLSASLSAEAAAQAGIPIAFASAAATHIVQATHANAKTKACSKSVAASAYGNLRQTGQPLYMIEIGF